MTVLVARYRKCVFCRSHLVAMGMTGGCGCRHIASSSVAGSLPASKHRSSKSACKTCSRASACACVSIGPAVRLPAGRVDQFDAKTAQWKSLHEIIARGARLRADQGLAAGQGVEQAALAGVGPAGQHDAEDAIGQAAPLDLLAQQRDLGQRLGQGAAASRPVGRSECPRRRNPDPLRRRRAD